MKTPLRIILHTIALATAGMLVLAWIDGRAGDESAAFPGRPIKLVVPFNQGGGSDTFARIIESGVAENSLLPEPLVIVNRPGGSSTIGSRYVKDARPDGYTLLMLHDAIITAQQSGKVSFGPRDFVPVAGTGEIGLVVAVAESAPWQTLPELLEDARRRPDEIVYGVNLGAPSHFLALRLEHAFPGAKFRYTSAGDGTDRMQKMIGGHIDVATYSATEFLSFRSKGLRGLALCSPERRDAIAEVPTAIEQGVDVVEVNMQYWWYPLGTPPDRVARMADVLRQAMQTETVLKKLDELKMTPRFLAGDELETQLTERLKAAAEVGQVPQPDVPDLPAAVLIGLAGCVVVMTIERYRRPAAPVPAESKPASSNRTGTVGAAVLVLACACGLAGVMQAGLLSYAWATTSFMLITGLALGRARRSILLPVLETAFLIGFGTHYVLTEIVVVDLP